MTNKTIRVATDVGGTFTDGLPPHRSFSTFCTSFLVVAC